MCTAELSNLSLEVVVVKSRSDKANCSCAGGSEVSKSNGMRDEWPKWTKWSHRSSSTRIFLSAMSLTKTPHL